nr:Glutamate-5-kinase [uncultured bacterium]
MKRIVVKIGTQCLIDRLGYIRQDVISGVMNQVICLKKRGFAVLLVTSGAVATGKALLKRAPQFLNSRLESKVAFSLGMPRLFNAYQDRADQDGLLCAQILLTKNDFKTRDRYLQIMHLFEGLIFEENIIPIVNENDAVSSPESAFVDNDELAGLLAAQVRAHRLIIFTTVNGVYDKNPNDYSDAQLIREISPEDIVPTMDAQKSQMGRGGMQSKLNTALKVSKLGIETVIAHIDQCGTMCWFDEHHEGTKITASRNVSAYKRWLSFCQGVAGVYVNSGAIGALQTKNASLLPVGITEICGEFKKGDVIYVFNEEHKIIAIGQATYDSTQLQHYLGQSQQPELLHCNNMYVY